MLKNHKRTSEQIRYWQELRRSNASAKHVNKSKYSRKKSIRKIPMSEIIFSILFLIVSIFIVALAFDSNG